MTKTATSPYDVAEHLSHARGNGRVSGGFDRGGRWRCRIRRKGVGRHRPRQWHGAGGISRGARGGIPRTIKDGSIAMPYGEATMCAHAGKVVRVVKANRADPKVATMCRVPPGLFRIVSLTFVSWLQRPATECQRGPAVRRATSYNLTMAKTEDMRAVVTDRDRERMRQLGAWKAKLPPLSPPPPRTLGQVFAINERFAAHGWRPTSRRRSRGRGARPIPRRTPTARLGGARRPCPCRSMIDKRHGRLVRRVGSPRTFRAYRRAHAKR